SDLWANLGVSHLDGLMYCSAFARQGAVNIGDRAYFRDALKTGDFAAGNFIVTRVRGLGAIGFGYPVRDAGGKTVGVASASLRVDTLQRQLDALPLPPRVAVQVVDRAGVVVLRRADRSAAAARPFGPEIVQRAMAGAIQWEGAGADGVRRVFGFASADSVDGPVLHVIAAVPTELVEAPTRALSRRTLGSWAIAMALVLAATGFVAEYRLIRRFRAVSRAAARIAAGDHSARTGLPRGHDELGDVVGAFDDMAASLQQLQRQNRLLLDSIGDGIVGLDPSARVVFANPAAGRLLGIPPEELAGQPFASLVHRAGPRADPCLVQQSLQDGEVHLAADDAFTRRDGVSFPAESVTTPVVDGGKIVGAVVALRDVSERRRLEDQLRQAQKMEAVGQLAGGVAHDFNNLLTAIITCGRMVQESLPPNHPAQPDVAEIISSGDRAAQLTRQLLAFARRQRLAPRPIDLRQAVSGMERMLRRVLGETIALSVEVPAQPVVIHADPGQIEMVVLNLAVNARDAMPSGGDLEISVGVVEEAGPDGGASRPMAQLSVRDWGVGMEEELQDRIFEPFFTTKPSGQGTGLGLATVYGIVKQSDGVIHVRSARGEGTEFRVLFPLHPSAALEEPPKPVAATGGTERVLVLEDDDVLRALVCRALSGAGYGVVEASRPSAAVERAAAGPLDLIVTDLVLPEET
ncbi:MAG TPA: ATP-binding protein, partial [Anaeromyxobacteraceae bacterium]|nr:ATP-binding protein [Anaeromyxobacteraceae bacterium]